MEGGGWATDLPYYEVEVEAVLLLVLLDHLGARRVRVELPH